MLLVGFGELLQGFNLPFTANILSLKNLIIYALKYLLNKKGNPIEIPRYKVYPLIVQYVNKLLKFVRKPLAMIHCSCIGWKYSRWCIYYIFRCRVYSKNFEQRSCRTVNNRTNLAAKYKSSRFHLERNYFTVIS